MKRKLILATTLGVLAGLTTGIALNPIIHAVTTPCPTEDSTGCYWNGAERGNQTGASFVTLDDDTVIYLTERPETMPCSELPDGPVPDGTVCVGPVG